MARTFNNILKNIILEAKQEVSEDTFIKVLQNNQAKDLKTALTYFTQVKSNDNDDYINRIKRIFGDMKVTDFKKADITLSFKKQKDNKIININSTLTDPNNPQEGTLLSQLINGLMNPDGKPDEEVASVFEGIKGYKELKDQIVKTQKNLSKKEKGKIDVDSLEGQWENMGKIITYKCVEMLQFSANSKTNIDAKKMQEAMTAAFGKLPPGYLQQFVSIDQKMTNDAVTMTLKELVDSGEMNESYFINYVNNMLNEEDEGSSDYQKVIEDLKEKGYKFYINKLQDPKSKKDVQKYIKAVKTLYKDEFEKNFEKLQAQFEKGRTEMLEEEKSDDLKLHYDPVTNRADNNNKKRVGRLGNHGPMTFIKNHEDLNKAVEAIDGQDWNIFNCGAKLLIKLFKLIEHGSKKWQEFKENWKMGYEKFKKETKKKDINDYIKDIEQAEMSEQAISISAIGLAKYENQLLDGIELNIFVPSKENEKVLVVDEKAKNEFIRRYKLLSQTQQILDALQKKLDEIAKNAKKEPKEGTNESYIMEADDAMQDTQKEVNAEADKVKKNAQKNQDQNKEQKEEKPEEKKSKEELHAEEQNKNWQKMDFKVDISGVGDYFESIDSYVDSDNTIKAASEYFKNLMAKDAKYQKPISVLHQVLEMCDLQVKGHFLTSEEICLKKINGGKFVQLWTEMLESLKNVNINDLEGFKDSIDIEDEEIKSITGEMAFIDSKAITYTPDNGNDNDSSEKGEVQKLTQDIVKDIVGTDQKNYKAAIEDIKKKKNELTSKWVEHQKKWKGTKDVDKAKQGLKDNLFSVRQLKLFFHTDGTDKWWENEHILPTIWLINNYFSNINDWNNKYKIGTIEEATNSEMDKGIDAAFEQIKKCIPEDIKSDIYKKKFDDWMKTEYTEFNKIVSGMIAIVEKNKDKMNTDTLKEIGVESVDKYLEFLKNDKNDPVLKLEYLLAYFETDDDNKKEGEDNKPSEEVQNQILQIGHEVQQSTALIANMNKQMKFDRSAYEKLVNQFKTEKEQNEKIFKANDFFSDKNKAAQYWNYLNADFKEDNGSIVCKIHLMNRILQNVATGKFGLKKENFDEVFDPLLVEDYNENDVKARIKTANDFIAKFCITPDNYTDPKWEALYYKLSLKDFAAQYGKDFVENVKAIYEQVKEIYESNKDNYEEEVKKIMEGGPGNFDLYIILLACEQIITNKGENKEEKSEGETSEEGSQEGTQEQKPENESIKFENPFNLKLFNECYKYIRG